MDGEEKFIRAIQRESPCNKKDSINGELWPQLDMQRDPIAQNEESKICTTTSYFLYGKRKVVRDD